MLQHAQELLETIEQVIGPEAERPEEAEGGEIEYDEDEDEEMN